MTVPLLQLPRPLVVDANGVPRAGAKLYIYQAGTSTPIPVYQDAALSALHPSPIEANTDGLFPPIYADPALGDVKINITTAKGVQVPGYPIDNIPARLPASIIDFGTTRTQAEVNKAITPTDYSFRNGPSRYGAKGDGVTDDVTAWTSTGTVDGYHFVYDGTYSIGSKIQTSAFVSIEGSSRQNTVLMPASGFPDFLLEIGASSIGPNPNVGLLRRLRFTSGFASNAGMLHMNAASHMWHLDELLFQSSLCPALILSGIFDSNYSNIDILNCGYANQPASIGAAIILKAVSSTSCNNIYFRGLRVEQCPSGSMYVDATSGPIYWVTGKIDQGFAAQVQPPITIDGSGINGGILNLAQISITGHTQFAASVKGTLRLNNCQVDGGTGVAAHILDQRAWAHIDPASFPPVSAADCGPVIGLISLIGSSFGYSHPSQSAVTPAVLQSKIPGIRAVAQVTVTGSAAAGSNTTVQTSGLSIPNNQSYNGCYLVHNSTGTQAATGQAGARRKILGASSGAGQLLVQGNWAPTLDADWSIEYCGGHYTPRLLVDDIQMDASMTLFAVLQTGATISGPSYSAAGGAAGGATSMTIAAANFPVNTDATGYYLVDEVTGEPFYINYGVDGSTKLAVLYDRTADLNTSHTYSIVAGYPANIKQNGTSYEWSFAGKRKTAPISAVTAAGFDVDNLPLWGIGTTGEPVTLPYSASINIDMAAGHQFGIVANNNSAFTINNPTDFSNGDELIITINNTSGGALGALTWGSAFKLAAWTQPGSANNRSITFRYNGAAWKEISRTPSDVPN